MFKSLFKESAVTFLSSSLNIFPKWLVIIFYSGFFLIAYLSVFPWWLIVVLSFISLDLSVLLLVVGFVLQFAYMSF